MNNALNERKKAARSLLLLFLYDPSRNPCLPADSEPTSNFSEIYYWV
jgi:hypothetical protein